MKLSSRDKAEGALHEVNGKIKEVVGKITDNSKLTAEGKAEQITGHAQGKAGEVKEFFGK